MLTGSGPGDCAVFNNAVFGSNTSTLPITSLAKASKRPANFIGVHFFSPVDKMMLVEIILGKQTGEEALAVALDYVRAIRKTPIVVNDSRGFYANRCVLNYIQEGHLMLLEGIPAAMIENAGRMAGMPVGPLSLNDEVAVDLTLKIGEDTGDVPGALENIAETYENELSIQLRVMTNLIEPAMIVTFVIIISVLAGNTGDTDEYYTVYDNVGGVKLGTLVFYEGYQVGQVDEVVPAADGRVAVDAFPLGWQHRHQHGHRMDAHRRGHHARQHDVVDHEPADEHRHQRRQHRVRLGQQRHHHRRRPRQDGPEEGDRLQHPGEPG